MLRENPVKKKLRMGKASVGSWVNIPSPAVAELMGSLGFEWLCIDSEHGTFNPERLADLVRAIELGGASPMVRVPSNDPVVIKQFLELGVEGLVIPLVNSAEEAESAVRAARYAPQGIRGMGLGRGQLYGQRYREYIHSANDQLLICIQVEHIEAVQQIEEILSVPGIDAVFIGRADLSSSMGLLGGENDPHVWELTKGICDSAIKHSIAAGLQTFNPKDAAMRIQQGYRFVALGVDVVFLAEAASQAARGFLDTVRENPELASLMGS